jgi:hypothetical protein
MNRIGSILLTVVMVCAILYLSKYDPTTPDPHHLQNIREHLAKVDSLLAAGARIREKEIRDSLRFSARLNANNKGIQRLIIKHDTIDLSYYTDPELDSLGRVLFPDSLR